MALEPLSPDALARMPTLFAGFMGRAARRRRTVRELLAVYRERSRSLAAAGEAAEHLRIGRFIDDMAASRWSSEVVVRIGVFDGTVLLVDGTHRGVAYLACLEQGIRAELLPPLCVEC